MCITSPSRYPRGRHKVSEFEKVLKNIKEGLRKKIDKKPNSYFHIPDLESESIKKLSISFNLLDFLHSMLSNYFCMCQNCQNCTL